MSKEAQISLSNYTPQEFEDGYTAEIISLDAVRQKARGTARHETNHAIINPDNVKRVTIHPGPGYLGLTELYEFDAVAAAAPAEAGDSGTGWDEQLIHLHRHDLDISKSIAGKTLADLGDEVDEVSATLEEKGEISGFEVKEAMARAGRRRARIKITDPEGKVTYLSSETNKRNSYKVTLGIERNSTPDQSKISPFSSKIRTVTPLQHPAVTHRIRVLSNVA